MVKAFVIGWPTVTKSGEMTLEAAKKRFERVQYVPINKARMKVTKDGTSVYYKNTDLGDYDAIFPRISISYKDWGYTLCKILSQRHIWLPYSPETVLWAHNKFLTIELLKRHKLPVPDTYLAIDTTVARKLMENMKFPLIMKLIAGAGGKGVMYLDSPAGASTLFDTLHTLNEPIFIEEFIKNKGEDIRAFVIGDEVFGYKRIAAKGEKRANLHSGGKARSYILSSEEENIAIRSARAIKADVCGVDIIQRTDGEPLILEVNISPGLQGITAATGKNIAEKIVNYTYDQVKR